jgi:hypothetical protein
MDKPAHFSFKLNTREYSVLSPIPPFVDIILQNANIDQAEFNKIVQLARGYQSDPRLVEMVRRAGDTSAKIPYLLDEHETPESILAQLRKVAAPHVEYLHSLPLKMQATIQTLLSVNKLPTGYEIYGIPALLEIDRIQHEMITDLKKLMAGRRFAEEFYQANVHALRQLDEEWPKLSHGKFSAYWPEVMKIPETPVMQYEASFEHGRMHYLFETCVIVDPPRSHDFKRFIPPVLQRPLPEMSAVPQTGSADWLIREVGKVGRHITRALLELIRTHLEEERIAVVEKNYELISREAQDVLEEHIGRLP